jgi:hypothetical protein
MKTRILFALVIFILIGTFLFAGEQISISIVYDNYAVNQSLSTDWGFGCIIRMPNRDILFDTGTNGSMLLTNMEMMNINPKDIDIVVISHKHMDHGGGLGNFLRQNANVKVYVPTSCSIMKIIAEKQGAECQEVSDFLEIADNVYSTGEMEYKAWALTEQSLVLDKEKGLIVITGCAHPGIVDILKKAKPWGTKGEYKINEKWIDAKGEIWYKVAWEAIFSTYTYYELTKISKSGTVKESVCTINNYPDKIDPEDSKLYYRIYYRQ